MLKSLVKALGLVVGLVVSGFSYAISMGDINVANTLGEPMNVLIELGTASKDEISSLTARLAPPEVFKDAGLDYPSGLPPLNFKIETNANGEPYIKVTSVQPINEPFVNLLVELAWSSGKLLREYTFLLDPPGYVPIQPQPAEVRPVEPSVVDVSELEPKAIESKAKEEIIETPLPSTALVADEKKAVDEIPATVNEPSESSSVISDSIKVRRGDTLGKLARQTKSSDVSLERALVALYHANTDAFDGKNMNRLKTGKILQIPAQSELDNLSQMQAVKEIRAQADDWHAYRQKLAAASGLGAGEEPKQGASGKISTTVADNAPAAKESAKEVVRLSKGEAPGDKTSAGGNAKSLQNKIHAMEEEAISKGKALQESNERVAALEKNVQDLQRLIDLKSQPPAAQVAP
ncbi:MAG: FimV/HubP family polar landmark protein, partial [Candidatus Nitrotoga sp.]